MAEYVDLTLDSETSDSETSENSCSIIQKRVKNEEEEDDFLYRFVTAKYTTLYFSINFIDLQSSQK